MCPSINAEKVFVEQMDPHGGMKIINNYGTREKFVYIKIIYLDEIEELLIPKRKNKPSVMEM